MPISFDGTEGSFDACVSHFKNKKNNRTGKNFTSEESHKVCGALQHRQEKGKDYLFSENIEIKEQDEDYYIEGFISSSNPDLSSLCRYPSFIFPNSICETICFMASNVTISSPKSGFDEEINPSI